MRPLVEEVRDDVARVVRDMREGFPPDPGELLCELERFLEGLEKALASLDEALAKGESE